MMDNTELKYEFNNEDQCCVCLSIGRKLFNLGEYVDIFRKITADLDYQNHVPLEEIQLCYECYAFVRRLNAFILKVNKAFELFGLGQNHIYGTQSNLTTIILNESHPQTLYINDVAMATDIRGENNVEQAATDDVITNDIFIDDFKVEEVKEKTEPKKPKTNRWAIKRALQNKKPKFKILTKYTKDSFQNIQIDETEIKAFIKSEREREYYKSKRFKCETCVIVFYNEDLMKQHSEKFHDESNPYTCDLCNSRYSKKRHLVIHIRNHYKRYLCTVCDFATCDKLQRQSHYKKEHRKVFQCLKCKLKFSRRREFFKHYKDWHEQFICDYCGISFKMKYCIRDHIRKQHSPYKCLPCDRTFSRYNGLWLHNKTAHGSHTPRYCVECDTHYAGTHRYRWHLANSARHSQRGGTQDTMPWM
ncbi:unnamed protein product [Chrysodeixis includens]|uniref:C2H2-type domain-containing protein n=1 Tax=Chrysodeixis includens TaxID=689277 RepID=A0A9P0BZ13_CHRIL|nr:unnamed protein product [Chrysodeixis includens]